MTNREMENRLAEAVRRTAPDNFEDVISRSETGKRNVNFMMDTPKKKWNAALVGGLIAACLVLMSVGGGLYYHQTGAVASVISLDVNPSIELTVNRNEKVISCTPLNADAALVLFDMDGGADLKGTKIDVAVNAIVGTLVRHGYLDSVSSAILITVEDSDQERAARLQTELSDITHSVLLSQDSGADVISQTLTMDAGLTQQAQQNNISSGKAALVNQVIAMNDSLSFDALAVLSVEELQDLLRAGAPAMPIGKSNAGYAAGQYAGTLLLDSVITEVDSELDETPAHYEVELHTAFGEFEYIIEAYTGEVLRGQANILELVNNPIPSPQPEGTGQAIPDSQQPDSAGQTTPAPQQPEPPATVEDGYIGLEAAKSAALAHAGIAESSTLYCNCWLEYDDSRPECYKVEFAVDDIEYEYEISLYSDTVLKHETETHHASHQGGSGSIGNSSGITTDIGQDAAKSAALTHAGLSESQVTGMKVELDYEDGRLEYEVEFRYGSVEYEYTIDGVTGSVLKYELDDD